VMWDNCTVQHKAITGSLHRLHIAGAGADLLSLALPRLSQRRPPFLGVNEMHPERTNSVHQDRSWQSNALNVS
jgi:hypothetical protein